METNLPDDGIAFFVGEALFCLSYFLNVLKIKVKESVVIIERNEMVKFVKILHSFLKKSERPESHILGSTLIRIQSGYLKLGSVFGEPICLTLSDIRTFLGHFEAKIDWLMQDLPKKSQIVIMNFVLLMAKLRKDVPIRSIISILEHYDQFSAEIMEITLESSELSQDELLKIEAFHLLKDNVERVIFSILACRHGGGV